MELPRQARGKNIRFRSSPPPPSSPSTSLTTQQQSKRRKTTTLTQKLTKTFKHSHTSTSTHKHQYHQSIETRTPRKETPFRQWVFAPHDSSHLKDEIVVVSYNILGVQNAHNHPYLYNGVSPRYLKWEGRKRRIVRELSCYNASVLCLQEVDRFSDMADLLKEDGFDGIHKARTGDACDGCAIFWKEDLYTLVHQESIEFREFGLRDNVAQFCVLKMKSIRSDQDKETQITQTQTILIGNIHALYNPKRGDIKMGQIRLFVKKAHTLSEKWGNIPVVIAGDLNSTPQSAIYKFLASSELDLLCYDRRQLSGQLENRQRWRSFGAHTEASSSWSKEELQLAAGSEEITRIQNYLQLNSAYVGVPGSTNTRDGFGEPLATSYHSSFMGTVDYIWHSKDLIPVGVVETLPHYILRNMRGLPSEEWGSDHFALVCKLAFTDSNEALTEDQMTKL